MPMYKANVYDFENDDEYHSGTFALGGDTEKEFATNHWMIEQWLH